MPKLGSVSLPAVPLGGAAGQVLTKNTATDFDASWATPSPAASTGVGPFTGASGNYGYWTNAGQASGIYSTQPTAPFTIGKIILMPVWLPTAAVKLYYVYPPPIGASGGSPTGLFGFYSADPVTRLPATLLGTTGSPQLLTGNGATIAFTSPITLNGAPDWFWFALALTSGTNTYFMTIDQSATPLPNYGASGPAGGGANSLVAAWNGTALVNNPVITGTSFTPWLRLLVY